jgi:hypothetical protein
MKWSGNGLMLGEGRRWDNQINVKCKAFWSVTINFPVQQINPNKNKQKYEKGKLENALSAARFEKLQHISGDLIWPT